mgnify:CR=1 FL=1
MKYSELLKLLKKSECIIIREGGGHTIWKNPATGQIFTVGRHKTEEVPIGTLKSILKAAGLQ